MASVKDLVFRLKNNNCYQTLFRIDLYDMQGCFIIFIQVLHPYFTGQKMDIESFTPENKKIFSSSIQ